MKQLLRLIRTARHYKFSQIINLLKRKIIPVSVAKIPAGKPVSRDGVWTGCRVDQIFDGRNCFTFLNESREVISPADWNRCSSHKLWLYNLHYFDFLRQKEPVPPETGHAWIARWIAENPPGSGNGWEPYPLSLRIVNWIKWHWSGQPLDQVALDSLAMQLRYLEKQVEYHLLNNHLLANAKALIFGGVFFRGEEARRWRKTGWRIYRRWLPVQILPDGGHFERSPMYHAIILEDLLDVRQAAGGESLDDFIRRQLVFLRAMTTPDGMFPLFNDASFGIAPTPAELFEYAERLGFPPLPLPSGEVVDFSDSGVVRLQNGQWTLFLDAGDLGPDYQLGHAHADSLTFELFYKNRGLIVDTGTSGYEANSRRLTERGTAAHNTIVIDGKNSSELWGAYRVGRRAKIIGRRRMAHGFSASHNGYAPLIHHRSWSFEDEKVLIRDNVSGKGAHRLELRFHLASGVEVRDEGNGRYLLDHSVRIVMPNGLNCRIEPVELGNAFGKTTDSRVLLGCAESALPQEFLTMIESVPGSRPVEAKV